MLVREEIEQQRRELVSACIDDVRALERDLGVTREALAAIAARVLRLALNDHLFDEVTYPNPAPAERAKLYLLSEDSCGRFPLYLTCSLPGGNVAPHNHTTWAVVAGLSGQEQNTLWARVDGGHAPGLAIIAKQSEHVIGKGDSLALMPDDIHSVATPGTVARRHFHMYGLSLQLLPTRLVYNLAAGTCDLMPGNDKIVR
jgi:predicted metal-dependent enzyme (double-stranded beta helix superfamily)